MARVEWLKLGPPGVRPPVLHSLERGISRGDLSPDVDAEMLTDLLLGPIYYRFFLSGSPLDKGFGVRLVSTLFSRRPAHGGTP